ncbi:MAG TPA: phage terminase large subunit [Ruminiclostridium sp.]
MALTAQSMALQQRIAEYSKKILVKNNYAEYCLYVHRGRWFLGDHLKLVCDNIQSMIAHETKQNILIISMPPQHGKSQCVTETLPSWYLGKFPSKRVIEVSYGDDLAQRFGRRNKEKVLEFGKQIFDIELSKQSDTDFEIKGHKGSMISKGIMAGLTGNPGDLIIIDDPIKNRQEAESQTYRDRIWEEFLNSINTRLSADGIIILIMTRWHEDDLAGRLLDAKNGFKHKCLEINIPLEAEKDDILGRNIGDALFPQIGKDNVWLKDFKSSYASTEGSRSWNALMQGRPTAEQGNMIKRSWFKYYTLKPERFDQEIQSWDCTFKDSDGSDFVVGTVWGRVGADKYLLDIVRERMDLPTTIRSIEQISAKYPNSWLKLVEDKANGSAVIQMLQHKIPGMVGINPMGSKIARVQAILPHIEAGNVYLPSDANWVNDFVDECSSFPNGKHDDQVDSMSQALVRLISDYSTLITPLKKKTNWMFETPEEKGDLDIW